MSDQINVTFGRIETGAPLTVDFGYASHMLISGQSRAGKSQSTTIMLCELSRHSNVQIWGLDPTGILLAPFDDDHAHIATGTQDLEHHLKVLESLVTEMNRRISDEIRGKWRDKIDTYGADLPLIVFVLEEWSSFQALVADSDSDKKPADRVGPKMQRLVSRLIFEGAKAGIRVLMILQRASSKSMNTDHRSQFATTVTFRQDNMDSIRMAHSNISDDLARELMRAKPGVGLFEAPGEQVVRFRGKLLGYSDYVRLTRRNIEANELRDSVEMADIPGYHR